MCEDAETPLPKRFTVSAETEQGRAVITALPVTEDAECVRVYYSEDEPLPEHRNWKEAKQIEGEKYKFEAKLMPWCKKLYAYANATYAPGFTVSSVLHTCDIADSAPARCRSALIYDSSMAFDSFTVSSRRGISLSDLFFEQFALAISPGYGGIEGIRALSGNLTTYKIGDPSFSGRGEELFKFDAYSAQPQTLELIFYDRQEEARAFSCEIALLGGGMWQPVIISKEELKNEQGVPLKDWQDVYCVAFEANKELLINNLLWL